MVAGVGRGRIGEGEARNDRRTGAKKARLTPLLRVLGRCAQTLGEH